MALNWSTGTIAQLTKRHSVDIAHEQERVDAPILASGELKTLKKPETRGAVTVVAGEPAGVGTLADAGSLPAGSDVTPGVVYYDPVIFFGRVKIGRLAARNVTSRQEGIDLLEQELRSTLGAIKRQCEAHIFMSDLGSPTSVVTADTSTTFTIGAWAGFITGMDVDVYNSTTFIERIRVTKVAPAADPTADATITFSGGGTGGAAANTWTTSYTLYLRGQQSNAMVSYADVAHDSNALYGKAVTADNWFGNRNGSTGILSLTKMRNMSTRVMKRGMRPWKCLFASYEDYQRYGDLLVQNRRFANSKMDGHGGLKDEFEGRSIHTSGNIPEGNIYFHDGEAVQYHEFFPLMAEEDGDPRNGGSKAAVLIPDDSYTFDMQFSTAGNLRANKRSGTGHLAGITG